MAVPLALRAAAELEMRRRKAKIVAKLEDDDRNIPSDMTFRQWCEMLAKKGMKVDGEPFSLEDRPALVPVYDAIPTHPHEAHKQIVVIQKATQVGLTVLETLAVIYMAAKWEPVTIGTFMPSQSVAIHKSEHRFMRVIRSVPDLYRMLTRGRDMDGNSVNVGEGNVLTRKVGESILLFLWTTGKVTTESIPMSIVTLDEVQEMALDHIDKVMARLGDSRIGFVLMLSTANDHEMDINYWYLQGTQEVWHTRCPHCDALSDLSDPTGIFPDKSITYNNGQIEGAPLHDYAWTCPECGGWIPDPQYGEPIAQNPGSRIRSFMLPRTISPKLTPREMIEGWGRAKTGNQKKSFYNRTLARPYIDADQLPVTMAHCLAAVAEGARMGVGWKPRARDTYMGIDQMGGFHAVIIKERLPDGRQAVIHVEAVFANPTPDNPDASPWIRSGELMQQYGVSMCVVEQLPNVDEARKFCNRFRGRAFMAGYADMRDDMIVWGDELSKSDRKTSEEDRSRYAVTLSQYKCMQTSLYRISNKFCLFADPSKLEQDVLEGGKWRRIVLLRDWVFLHFTKTALVVEQEGDESVGQVGKKRRGLVAARKTRTRVAKVGLDPHFSYANMLCDVAWARNHGTGMVWFPDRPREEAKHEDVQQAWPGLPHEVAAHMVEPPKGEVCGRCTSYDRERGNWCAERDFSVRANDPGCSVFVPG